MALAIDSSSPTVATQTSSTTATVTSASFTPPAGALLLIGWAGNTGSASDPGAPSITDSLGAHLTYTQIGWKHRSVSPTVDGQAAMWWAVVGSSAAMTVTVTTGTGSGARQAALKVWVITGQDTSTPISTTAKGIAGSASAASIAQNYTATATSGWGFLAVCDWDLIGAETAGTGCTVDGSANILSDITYTFARRTTADDSNGVTNTLRTTLPGTSTNLSWVYAEVQPASGGATPISLAEAGAAAETASIAAAAPLADAGSSSEAAAVNVTSALPDTASSTETLAVAASTALAEAGAAAESVTAAAATGLADSGAAADSLVSGIAITLTDTGAAADSFAATPIVPLPESGSAGQSLAVTSTTGLADGGSAADSLAVAVAAPLADVASAAQALTAAAALALTDAAAAVETVALAASVALAQSASAADGLSVDTGGSGTTKQLNDSGAAADSVRLRRTQLRPSTGITHAPANDITPRPYTGTVED